MKLFLAHASAFDFRKKLYEPLRTSALNTEHEIILPEERKEIWNTKEDIESCDAFVVDVSMHSTGAGIEMGWAHAGGVPIIAIHEKGSAPSSVVGYVATIAFEYDSPADLLAKLEEALKAVKKY